MKKKLILPILAVALAFSACKLTGDSNYVPGIGLYNPILINSDTLDMLKKSPDGNIMIDSLFVNDTVTVVVGAEGFMNNLLKLNFKVDNPAKLEILEPHDSIKAYFDPSSDFINGSIIMRDKIVKAFYPFKFVTLETSEKVKIDFRIESDAKEVANTSVLTLQFPIK